MMNTDLYSTSLRDDARAIIDVAARHAGLPAPAVPTCPGWGVGDLVLHLGGVHRRIAKLVRDRERTPLPQPGHEDLAFLAIDPRLLAWFAGGRAPAGEPLPTGLVEWFADGAASLGSILAAVDPDEPVWTWSTEQRAGFWRRMMAIETAVHRWDAQEAYGHAEPIGAALAQDGVDHALDVMLPARRAWVAPRAGAGERYRFRRTDGPGDWTVRFSPDGVLVARVGGTTDVVASGTASDLFLFLWGRLSAHELEASGDVALLDRFAELVPPR